MIKQKVTKSWKKYFVSTQEEFQLMQSYIFHFNQNPPKVLVLFDLNHNIFFNFVALTLIYPALYVRILIYVF